MLLVYTLIMESTQLVCRAYTFLDCLLALWSTHTTQRGRMQRKFCGFPYIRITLTIVPFILMDSYFPMLQAREYFYPTTLRFISLLDYNDMTSNIPYVDPSLGKRTICWLVGAWPRFKGDLAKQILVLLAFLAIVRGARTEVSPEVVWEGARIRFPHVGDVWWFQVVRSWAHCYVHFPVTHNLRYCLHAALLGVQTVLLPMSLLIIQY